MHELAVVEQPSHKGNSGAAGCNKCPGLLSDALFRSRAIDPLGQRAAESNVATRSGPGHKYSAGWDSRASKGTMLLGWHLSARFEACSHQAAAVVSTQLCDPTFGPSGVMADPRMRAVARCRTIALIQEAAWLQAASLATDESSTRSARRI
jgi:hypothetical protein